MSEANSESRTTGNLHRLRSLILAGQMNEEEAAKRLGCSVPTIKRGMERVKKAQEPS